MARLGTCLAAVWLIALPLANAIQIDFTSPDSIKSGAAVVAFDLMSYYSGNDSGQTPGLLPVAPEQYYWWECGAMMGTMVDYWHYTGDTTYNDVVSQALQFQVGPHDDYMPPNQTASLGNDDQAFWAMAALSAAETNFQNPSVSQPSWLALSQAVFNEQAGRWDTQYCNGGLRWQIYQVGGYDLKNSIANGAFFQIGARLARYTGDSMYAQWCEKVWDWMWRIGLIDNETYAVYDNAEADRLNCTSLDHNEWSYNIGTMLVGAATMYNYTNGSAIWEERTSGLLNHTVKTFFVNNGVMKDICEGSIAYPCDTDQKSFKAYLSRWMAITSQMAPWTYDIIHPLLVSSATAAAAQCDGAVGLWGAATGTTCGLEWYNNGTNDGTNGVGQQMSALEVILGTTIQSVAPPTTNSTGGTSPGNPTAGYNSSSIPPGAIISPATHADIIGAWILTSAILCIGLFSIFFMWSTSWEAEDAETYFPPPQAIGFVANPVTTKRKPTVFETQNSRQNFDEDASGESAVRERQMESDSRRGSAMEDEGRRQVPAGYAQRAEALYSREGYSPSLLRHSRLQQNVASTS